MISMTLLFAFGGVAFRALSIALYVLTLTALILGCTGKRLVKKGGVFCVLGMPALLLLGSGMVVAKLASERAREIATGKGEDGAMLRDWAIVEGEKVFKNVYDVGKCKAFDCEKNIPGWFLTFLLDSNDQTMQQCQGVHQGTVKKGVLSLLGDIGVLGIFKRYERLRSTKVPVGMEQDFAWCHVAKGVYGFLATSWKTLFWTTLYVLVAVAVQSVVAMLTHLRGRPHNGK
jgi:hypothetical protein